MTEQELTTHVHDTVIEPKPYPDTSDPLQVRMWCIEQAVDSFESLDTGFAVRDGDISKRAKTFEDFVKRGWTS